MRKIKTGADNLIELIQESKRISLDAASKALGVSQDLVQEWAEFLEKEKLISIDYSFSKVFFTEHKMSSSEIKDSAKEFVFEKDAFVRKVEYALASLEKESVNFKEIKKKFDSIHGEVKDEIKIVERELLDLEKYDARKSDVDKDLEKQKHKFEHEFSLLEKDIKSKESEFVNLYTKIVKEKEDIDSHKARLISLQKAQNEITKSISSANSVLDKLKKDLAFEDSEMKKKLRSFEELSSKFEDLSNVVIREKKRKISDVSLELKKESEKIMARQEKLLKDAKIKVAKLDSLGDVSKKIKNSFEGFFSKTLRISKKIDEVENELTELRNKFSGIHKKAKALSIMGSNASLKKQALEVEAEIKKQEEAKNKLTGKIKSLLDDLRL